MKGKIVLKGGVGSGNFDHSGRPGKRGGSGPGGGKSSVGTVSIPGIYFPNATPLQAQLAYGNVTITYSDMDDEETIIKSGVTAGKELGTLADGTVVMLKPASDPPFRPTAAKSEVATYETAKLLGWDDLVTPSAERSDGRSIQVVQDGKTIQQYRDTPQYRSGTTQVLEDYRYIDGDFKHDMNRILLLDAITGNDDRHNNNVLVVQRGGRPRLMAIDNDGAYVFDGSYQPTADKLVRTTRMSAMDYNRPTFTKAELEPIVALSKNKGYESYLAGNFSAQEAAKTMQRVREIANWYEGAEN